MQGLLELCLSHFSKSAETGGIDFYVTFLRVKRLVELFLSHISKSAETGGIVFFFFTDFSKSGGIVWGSAGGLKPVTYMFLD